jgi:50S ribosomal protein L16 3-hydroxylase
MKTDATILDELLGDIPLSTFLDQHYFRLPLVRTADSQCLANLANWATIERLLACSSVDLIVGRGGEQPPGPPPANAAQARCLLDQGYTLGIRHAERHDPGLAKVAREFELELGAAADIHLYCTPAEQPGFGWHYDAEEVFVLQTHGEKEWWLRKNTVNPWPLMETIPADQRYEREIMPVLHCKLTCGDWLYIPNGYWHRTRAPRESISLSVGMRAASCMDLFDHLRPRLLQSIRWRQRVPCYGTASQSSEEHLRTEYQHLCRELATDLCQKLQSEEFSVRF